MNQDDLVFESAEQLARRVRAGELSALDVVDAHIRRIQKANPALNAIVTTDFDRARSDARAADDRFARGERVGSLHGVPVTIKDAINTAGIRTVAGSKLFVSNVPSADAPAVRKLRAAGAIVLGKTNVAECVMDWRTTNPVFGRTANPWNREYVPGGSSGGEAAAVAAGCSAGGLGTDLGGSIRVPAHYCGICGLRPTPGRVPGSGYALPVGGSFSLTNSFGPLARSVGDLELFFGVLAGFDPCDPVSVSLPIPNAIDLSGQHQRVAACVDGGIPITAETRQAVERAAALLAGCGADVTWWTLPSIAETPAIFSDWVLQPALAPLVALYDGREEMMGPMMRGLATLARPISLDQFMQAWWARDALRRSLLDRMEQRPILLLPVSSTPAFRHEQRGAFDVEGSRVDYAASFAYSAFVSLAGLPAVTLPIARTSNGLPVGVQLVGRPFEEARMLAVARLLEQAAGALGRPPV
jgi:Asp-tRNA(Asn)/Glu-tRNA(Gln) amidotransferase A subunit family amidase